MTDPNADLADIRAKWLCFCSHDLGLPYPCICPNEDHRPVIAALVTEVETLRAEVARLEGEVGVRWEIERALDAILGPNTEDGAGEGVVSDVRLVGRQRDQARADLAALHAEAARPRAALDLAERDKAHAVVDQLRLMAERSDATRDAGRLIREKRAVEAERDAMRPVVEAARVVVKNFVRPKGEPQTNLDHLLLAVDAVDQMAPAGPRSLPESDDRGEVAGTDTVEAFMAEEDDLDRIYRRRLLEGTQRAHPCRCGGLDPIHGGDDV